ncbi:MAG: T9SS type A sorting domain-containing protein [Sphingomonadales bacterium]|nr:T9SS type A sorting domain-containing protein [Sphingomonadales bacterium]
MKRFLLLTLFIGFFSPSQAQWSRPYDGRHEKRLADRSIVDVRYDPSQATDPTARLNPLWSFDFSNTLGMSVVRGLGASGSSPWKVVSAMEPNLVSQNFPPIASASGAPFALINSDSFSNGTQDDYLIIKAGISLVSHPAVMLSVQQFFRRFQEDHIIEISTDSLVWTELYNSADVVPASTTIPNPSTLRFNISSIAGNQPNLWIRFHYIGAWDWFWCIDDIQLSIPPNNDLSLEDYSINPVNFLTFTGQLMKGQQGDQWQVEGAIQNFGSNAQSSIRMRSRVGRSANSLWRDSTAQLSLASGGRDTVMSVTNFPQALLLDTGVYALNIELTMDSVDENPADNSASVPFAVRDTIISVVSPVVSSSGSLGTASFTGDEDGLICATLFELSASDTLSAIQIRLGTSVAGSQIIVSVRDTNGLANDEYAQQTSFSSLIESDLYTLTAQDLARGFVKILMPASLFGAPQNRILQPGAYFAAAELFSNQGAQDIRVFNDYTYERFLPYYTSIIYSPSDARWYTNGIGLAVNPVFGHHFSRVSVDEESLPVRLQSVFPNPNSGLATIDYTLDRPSVVEGVLRDIAGREVARIYEGFQEPGQHRASISLDDVPAGVYLLEWHAAGVVAIQKLVRSGH